MTPLQELGQRVAEEQDALLAESDDLQKARAAFLEHRRPSRRPALAFVAAAALLATVMIVWAARWPSPLTIEGGSALSSVGEWLDLGEGEEAPVRFSDGTTVLFQSNARAQIAALTAKGASITLDRGRALVSVAHARDAEWFFRFGPFDVEVTGTRFNAEWRSGPQEFSIEVKDGSVLVSGPTLEQPRPVVAGQSLNIALVEHTAEVEASSAAPPEEQTPPTEQAEPDSNPEKEDAATSRGAPQKPARSDGGPPDWRALAHAGDFKGAIAAAQALGLDGILQSSGGADLILLADAARLAGRTDIARRAYTTTRTRFPSTRHAALAAFSLGRLGGAGALGWLNEYLKEQPQGALAREALGRVLEIHHRSGNEPVSRRTAERYLAAHPTGPHAALARAILAKPGGTDDSEPPNRDDE